MSLPALKEDLNKGEIRMAIGREKRVELHLKDDTIRPLEGEKNLKGALHPIVIDEQGGVPKYRITLAQGVARTFFKEKNYFLPLPQSAIDPHQKLTKNSNH